MNKRLALLANRLNRRLSRSERTTRAAVLVRNQCQLLIGYHLARSASASVNGEQWLVEQLAGRVAAFVDVGANIGNWSRLMLANNPDARGILLEPSAVAAERLRAEFGTQVEILEAACADEEGVAEFAEMPDASELSSLERDRAALRGATVRTVPVLTIDSLLESKGIKDVDFLKIDTEGSDGRVLVGATKALQEQRLGIVQFEYNQPWALAGSTLGRELRRLGDAGYRAFVLRPDGLVEVDYAKYGEYFSYTNLVAVSERCRTWI
jgi:FkbM family methyltransferase